MIIIKAFLFSVLNVYIAKYVYHRDCNSQILPKFALINSGQNYVAFLEK